MFFDRIVIGGGVIGLAVARKCAVSGYSTLLVEKNKFLMNETSSRNSEVIHAGIYYEPGSLKAKYCIRGRHLLYDYLKSRHIPHEKIGKIIFCAEANEDKLDNIQLNAAKNDVNLKKLSKNEILQLKDLCNIKHGLFSSETGILDSHSLSLSLEQDILDADGIILTQCQALKFGEGSNSAFVNVLHGGEEMQLSAERIYNCAGHSALDLLDETDVDNVGYSNFFVKGQYYSCRKRLQVDRLLYPLPSKYGLGVHLTLDLQGNIKFGPDTLETLDPSDYREEENTEVFLNKIVSNFPWVKESDLSFNYAGVRPKISIGDTVLKDFVLETHFGGRLLSLLGIESPGLTAALAIAEDLVE